MSFDEFVAAKRAREAAAPPRVTWRRVSADTGGGDYEYGRVVDGRRVAEGHRAWLDEAKAAAAALIARPS